METKCPDCQKTIKLEADLAKGEIIECDNCGTELEIISLDPVKTQVLEEEK